MCLNHFLLSHIRLLLSNGKWREGLRGVGSVFSFFFLDCSSVCAWVRTWPDHNWMCHILRLFERLCLKRNLLRFMALPSSFSTLSSSIWNIMFLLRRQQQSWEDFQMNMIGFFLPLQARKSRGLPSTLKSAPTKLPKSKPMVPDWRGA